MSVGEFWPEKGVQSCEWVLNYRQNLPMSNAGNSVSIDHGEPMPNLSVPSISSSSGNRNFRSGDVIIQGNVDRETMPNFLAALADRDRKFSSNVNRIIDARERRTISRRERVLGR